MSHRFTQLTYSLARVQSHTPCIYRIPAVSSSHWTTAGKFRHSFTRTNSCKAPSLCRVPGCLQILFLQNFILAIGLTQEVKLGYCRLIYYAFFSYPRKRGSFLWWWESVWKKLIWLAKQSFLQQTWFFRGSVLHSFFQQAWSLRLHSTQPKTRLWGNHRRGQRLDPCS